MDGRLIIENKRRETKDKLVSKSPATLDPVGDVSLASSDDCREAVLAAKHAFPLWRDLPLDGKKKILRRAKAILLGRSDEVARLISLEKGSPVMEAMVVEILGSLETLDYYGRHLDRAVRPKKARPHQPLFSHKKSHLKFQPLGPTLVISPWNFPFLIPLCDVVSALSVGNTVVLRPSTSTPLIALLLGEIFMEAGLPPGVLNVVNCRTAQAEEMIIDPEIQTVMFTGSVGVGKRIMELASRNLTNVVLELGGKDPMIVCKDADLERAARGAVWAAFMNSGQSCASIERVYIAEEIEKEFTDRVVELARAINVGNPLEPGVDMGPMTTLGQLRVVEEHLQDARSRGATVLCGGDKPDGLPGYFITPAVLNKVDHSMKIMTEETFGPTLPIMTFYGLDEAVALANDCAYGLTASVWTRDRKTAAWLAERIEAGTVTVNDHMFSFTEPQAIWGGIKQTGMGRSHGSFGLHHLVNIKYVSSDFARNKGLLWWFPYRDPKPRVIRNALALLHQTGMGGKFKAALALLPSLSMVRRGVSFKSMLKIAGRFLKR
jgi:succinate-semialdehyde dehydrogenase/glutarate-semialdehyde dehydrogenase